MFEDFVLTPLISSLTRFHERNAFYINNVFYSYKDLAEEITGIRAGIRNSCPAASNVGLVVNDDLQTYASIIALWMEGLAYIPLHPRHPVERGEEIIRQAGIELILDSSKVSLFSIRRVIKSQNLLSHWKEMEPVSAEGGSNAYILFTSGSTGKPKGVPISRNNVGAFMKAFAETGISMDENDRCLQCFDLTFDVSVQSFVFPLTRGACVFTIPHDQLKPGYAYELMQDHRLTFGAMAPSMVRFLRPYFDEINLPDMRYNILTAEASPLSLVEEWSKCIPNAEIYDFYGPTEATIYCTYYKFNRKGTNKELNGMISIGKPMNGIFAIITDEARNILGTNIKGELCIAGDQITPGYWNNPDKNSSSFFELNLQNRPLRFYKTGDLCYIDEGGDIMYSGRTDFQVKIQGFRIELGEIEHHARTFLNSRNVAAVAFENKEGNNTIALFIEGELTDSRGLSEYLKSKMPYYMVPSEIITKEEFPLNSNGKTDRNELRKSIIR